MRRQVFGDRERSSHGTRTVLVKEVVRVDLARLSLRSGKVAIDDPCVHMNRLTLHAGDAQTVFKLGTAEPTALGPVSRQCLRQIRAKRRDVSVIDDSGDVLFRVELSRCRGGRPSVMCDDHDMAGLAMSE